LIYPSKNQILFKKENPLSLQITKNDSLKKR